MEHPMSEFPFAFFEQLQVQTERFILRPMTPADAENLYRLNADPEVIRYTGDSSFASVDEAQDFLKRNRPFATHRMGRWGIFTRKDKVFHGWCGLKWLEDRGVVDLGYRLFRSSWGQGIATETSRASLAYGFDVLHLEKIMAYVDLENSASLRVLQKLGFQELQTVDYGGMPVMEYQILAENWRKT
jgi:ribosomal-protein-alanine N-acetyltransferase